MICFWLIAISSFLIIPGTALWALHWAIRHGEFRNLPKTALQIFDDEEPVGRMTDLFPGREAPGSSSSRKVSP
jgi:nitrogen fixation-related uncharacterized protein